MPGSSERLADDSASLVPLRLAPGTGAGPGPTPDDEPTVISSSRGSSSSGSPADPSLGLAMGSHLGPFEVLEAVGVGGMATVLKARDREMGRAVALKILPPHLARDPDAVTRFKQEARAAARLDHDNVARAFASGEAAGLYYIAFEFVEGENLRTLIERRGRIPAAECVPLMLQVAAGLAHASARGVVHRDIKPSNIVVTPAGKAKIVDMGLARSLTQSVAGGVTQSGVTLGTFDYISPEQALDPRRADVRSDIYSMGCAFYHAVTGRPPVPEGTAARKLQFHQQEPVPDPRLYDPFIPDEFAYLLARMMAKDPARRFQTAEDLVATLTELGRHLRLPAESLAVEAAGVPAGPIHLLPQPPRLPRPVLAGGLVALAGVALVVALAGPSSGPRATPTTFDPGPSLTRLPEQPAGVPPLPAAPPTIPAVTPPSPPPELPPTVTGPPTAASTAGPLAATTLAQLAAALADPAVTEIYLEPGAVYDFTRLPAGVVATAKRLRLAARPPRAGLARLIDLSAGDPVIRVAAAAPDPADPAAARPGGLTFAGPDHLDIRGVAFELAAGPPPAGGAGGDVALPERPEGVVVVDAARFDLAECRFAHAAGDAAPADAVGLAVVARPAAGRTAMTARSTLFAAGQSVAVELRGGIDLEATECAFGPRPACLALRSFPAPAPAGGVVLRSCSFLLQSGCVAEVEPGGRWRVSAGFCVFAAPPPDPAAPPMLMPTDLPERRPAVVRALADKPDGVGYRGRPGERNGYYQVDPFALANRGFTFDEAARAWPTDPPALDRDAAELRAAPWAADPAAGLAGPRPWEAFKLNLGQPPLRVPQANVAVLGATALPREATKLYTPWPPAAPEPPFDPRIRVVDPAAAPGPTGELPRNVYPTLAAAAAAARPDDVVEIRHTGPLEVPQVTLDAPRGRLTVRPHLGSAPVLTAARDADAPDAALFRLTQGQLILENLEVRLTARAGRQGEARSLAAVAVGDAQSVTLRDCTVTLAETEGGTARLAAVLLLDPPAGQVVAAAPVVTLERTLVRGRGGAVRVASARPFDLTLTDCATALAGPVLGVEPTARAMPASGGVHVRLDRVTAVLGGPLVEFAARPRAADGRPPLFAPAPAAWLPADVATSRCLFVSLAEAPVVRLERAGRADDGVARLLRWDSAGSDWYSGFPAAGPWLEVGTEPDAAPRLSFTEAEWFAYTGDAPATTGGPVRLRNAPASARRLAAVEAADLAVESVTIPGAAPADAGMRYAVPKEK